MECKVRMGAWKVCRRCASGARRCAEGCTGGAGARAEWVGGVGVVGAGPVQRKSKKVENFRKCACFDRAYHENGQWQPGWVVETRTGARTRTKIENLMEFE